MSAVNIVAICGSMRERSYNKALLEAARELAPPDVEIEIATIRGIPVYDGDEEAAHGVPAIVEELKGRVAAADGLLLASPEYNNSLPGPLKNAIDWLSRPPKDIPRVFTGRAVGLIGATPGRGATRLAQNAWLPVFRTLGMRAYFERSLYVDGAAQRVDAQGRLTDATIRKLLEDYLKGFAHFVRHERTVRPVPTD